MEEQEEHRQSRGGSQYSMLEYRMSAMERDVKGMRDLLATYVPQKENDLQLKMIRESVDRIEKSIVDVQKEQKEQKESTDKLLIRVSWGVASAFISIIIAVAISYLTHLP